MSAKAAKRLGGHETDKEDESPEAAEHHSEAALCYSPEGRPTRICSDSLAVDVRVGKTRGELTGMLSRRPADVARVTLGDNSECVAATYSVLIGGCGQAGLHIGIVSEGPSEPVILSLAQSPFIFVACNSFVAAVGLSDGQIVTESQHVGPVFELSSHSEANMVLAAYETGFSAYSPSTGRLVWDQCLGDIVTQYTIGDATISAKCMEGTSYEIRLLDGAVVRR